MAHRPHSTSQTSIHVEPPRFDRPEVEVRASSRRKKTGTAHWSGSRIVVQIPARLRGRERAVFVDGLVERLLTQRPQNAAGDASLEERANVLAELYNDAVLVHELAHLQEADHSAAFYEVANRHPRQGECAVFLDGYALGLGLRIEDGDVDAAS
jgi:hypothetical protein